MQTVWYIADKKALRASNSNVSSQVNVPRQSHSHHSDKATRLPRVQGRVEREGVRGGVRVCVLREIALPLLARFLRCDAGVVQPMGRVRLHHGENY